MPPSSIPTPINSNSQNASTPRRRQPPTTTTGALDIGDDDDDAQADDGSAARRRKRVKGQIATDVPMVKDAVGESVAESFETFLKT
jgi:DNA replication licensing factor MCM6